MNLHEITIPTLDIAKAIAFYQNLGLNLMVQAIPSYTRFECPEGGSTFSIHLVDQLPVGTGVYLYFECEKIHEYVDQLTRKGIAFEEMPADKSWLWREARLKDADNNQVILYHAGENRLNPTASVQFIFNASFHFPFFTKYLCI